MRLLAIFTLFLTLIASSFSEAIASDISTTLMNSTFKIQGEGSTGTAFILGKPLLDDPERGRYVLFTAAHVLESMKSPFAILFLRTRQGDTFKKLPHPIILREKNKPLWIRHPEVDVAAMYVTLPKKIEIQLVSTKLLATDEILNKYEVHPGDELLVLGFPFGAESNEAGFPILRSGKIASYPLTPIKKVKTFLLDFEVFGGNSGGPVFMDFTNRVYGGSLVLGTRTFIMGVVLQQRLATERIKSVDQTIEKQHRLSLANVAHAQFLNDLLEMLPPSQPPEK